MLAPAAPVNGSNSFGENLDKEATEHEAYANAIMKGAAFCPKNTFAKEWLLN